MENIYVLGPKLTCRVMEKVEHMYVHVILDYIEKHGTVEGAQELRPEHLAVFDCAFKPEDGTRCNSPMDQSKMSAVFLTGGRRVADLHRYVRVLGPELRAWAHTARQDG